MRPLCVDRARRLSAGPRLVVTNFMEFTTHLTQFSYCADISTVQVPTLRKLHDDWLRSATQRYSCALCHRATSASSKLDCLRVRSNSTCSKIDFSYETARVLSFVRHPVSRVGLMVVPGCVRTAFGIELLCCNFWKASRLYHPEFFDSLQNLLHVSTLGAPRYNLNCN